jgi:hypothetical protein
MAGAGLQTVRGRASGQAPVTLRDVASITPSGYTPNTPLRATKDHMFVDPLGLPQVLQPASGADQGTGLTTDFYNVDITEHRHLFSSRLPYETAVWGYAAGPGQAVVCRRRPQGIWTASFWQTRARQSGSGSGTCCRRRT